jgi:hypothetical protein
MDSKCANGALLRQLETPNLELSQRFDLNATKMADRS